MSLGSLRKFSWLSCVMEKQSAASLVTGHVAWGKLFNPISLRSYILGTDSDTQFTGLLCMASRKMGNSDMLIYFLKLNFLRNFRKGGRRQELAFGKYLVSSIRRAWVICSLCYYIVQDSTF